MKKYIFGFLVSGTFFFSGCYYDVESELYPKDPNQTCDTLNIGYQARIEPIVKNNCVTCHSGSGASGNVSLDSYQGVKDATISRNLYGAISHTSSKPMPQDGNKLPDCDIIAIKKWIDSGHPQ
ncbi:c-type cytochrome [Adhaeribacter terreus]|uniref:C-type cytochrome n=1 Tax=Adhaeribacter terreus TaxID=529703 RepID=A0ABW0E5W7_9BACT